MPNVVSSWKADLAKQNPKAAESLADPAEYPNLFPDLHAAYKAEKWSLDQRAKNAAVPASMYPELSSMPAVDLIGSIDSLLGEEANGGVDDLLSAPQQQPHEALQHEEEEEAEEEEEEEQQPAPQPTPQQQQQQQQQQLFEMDQNAQHKQLLEQQQQLQQQQEEEAEQEAAEEEAANAAPAPAPPQPTTPAPAAHAESTGGPPSQPPPAAPQTASQPPQASYQCDAFNGAEELGGAGVDAQEEDDWGFNDEDEEGKAD
ncbi:hypothetical protein DUNSADRAFT_1450 [Dunaliella salina]|uniref:Uncharacterized protein n=1 Tax=Dunaliella salina TaxID=3046 RepID=A0ABQ7GX07_DUNSA|nr:hypothetical protein DUNSADRAFT_1450 [Dunaliella salina]|eukprot:KAF5839137.1 hypothetical protein DUNSADRAFT_1450 [Dunaliella salina]